MTVVHIVLFEFQPTANAKTVQDACDRMLELKEKCINPTTKKPYIVDFTGGKDMSIEGHQGGLTHGFVVKFACQEDRDYYVKEDPAHAGFVKSLAGVVEAARVLDYAPGVF